MLTKKTLKKYIDKEIHLKSMLTQNTLNYKECLKKTQQIKEHFQE